MVAHLIAAGIVLALAGAFLRIWAHLPPERIPADYAREVLEMEETTDGHTR